MTVSGTYNFNPSGADAVTMAYGRIGVRRTAITREHLIDAANEGNLLLTEWSSLQPNLWTSEQINQTVTEGVFNYVLPARVVMILTATLVTSSGDDNEQRRVLGALSTTEYASISNPNTQAPSSSYWFNRLRTPEINLWPVPDDGGPYVLQMQCVSQPQDMVIPSGVTLDAPYRGFDAFVAGLAYRLARVHAPEFEDRRKADYERAWAVFSANDVENTPFYVFPALGTYYRGQ